MKLMSFIPVLLSLLLNPILTAQQTPIPQTIEEYEAEKNLDQMLLLLQKRLAVMHEVARTKWNQNGKIEDKARETQILNDLSEQGKKKGLDEKWIGKFFGAQLEAAKLVQKNDFETWQSQGAGKFDGALDLKTELREYIDQINQELLDLLSNMQTKGYNRFERKYLLQAPISNRASDYVEPQVWQIAISPFY